MGYALLLPAVAAWVAAVIFLVRITRHAGKLEEPPSYIAWNPMNLVVRPDLWTPEARRDCIALFVSVAVFVTLVLIPFTLGAILR